MAQRMRLTDAGIRKLRPGEREYTVWDTRTAGFGVRVRSSGRRSFIYHWSEGSRSRKVTLGSTVLMTVADALARCREVQAGQRTGPAVTTEAPLFHEFVAGSWKTACLDRLKPSTQKGCNRVLTRQLLPAFGALRLDLIDRKAVTVWFERYSMTAPGGANNALALLQQILNHAINCGLMEINPVRGIRRNPRRRLNRFLSVEEIRRVHTCLDELVMERPEDAPAADIVRLLLLTGCRKGEILNLRWQEVDGGTLNLRDAKTGPRQVYLSTDARGVIDRQHRGASVWVFPSPADPGKPRPHIDRFWTKVRKRAGIEDVRMHDLRHTFASQAVMRGVPVPVVARLLGHSQATMTLRVYSHVADRDVEAAAERIGQVLADLTGQQDDIDKVRSD